MNEDIETDPLFRFLFTSTSLLLAVLIFGAFTWKGLVHALQPLCVLQMLAVNAIAFRNL